MALKTVEEANHELEVAIEEAIGDNPELTADEIWFDMMVATAWNIEDDDTAREFCRRQCGSIPYDLEGRLGRKNWIV
jgi:hypothetical protein